MIKCPICMKFVTHFKKNSHVMPRWVMVETKENGRNLSINRGKIRKNQKDLTTESWCERCEADFTSLDASGALFFRNLNKKRIIFNETNLRPYKYVFHDYDNYYFVSKFISSVIVRFYLHRLNKGKPVENEGMLSEVFEGFKGTLEPQIVLYDVSKFLSTSTKLPSVVKDGVQMMINGYLINLKISYSKDELEGIAKSGELLIFNVTDPNTPYIRQFFESFNLIKDRISLNRS